MAKKSPKPLKDNDEVDLEVESWQWETTSKRLTWKHWLIIVTLIAVAILFAFGFLIVALVLLVFGIILNLFAFVFKKLT